MYEITMTEKPSYEQVEKMVDNLKEKHGKGGVVIQVRVANYGRSKEIDFWIHVTDEWSRTVHSWEELQNAYRFLMEV